MKNPIKKLFILLAMVVCFVALQSVCVAGTLTVTGTIERIGEGSIDVVAGGEGEEVLYTFYHIPFSELEAAGIYLKVDDKVTVSAYVVSFPNGDVKDIAYSITSGVLTYTWHPNVPRGNAVEP